MPNLETLIILGLASGCAATTITQGEIFAGVREWMKGKSSWLGKLISCPLCLGHWTAFGLAVANFGTSGLLTKWLAITAISVLTSGLIGRLYGD